MTKMAEISGIPPKVLNASRLPKRHINYEIMKHEVVVINRIAELRRSGLWSRLPKREEPATAKSHWDYLLEEMKWMARSFADHRNYKLRTAKKIGRMCQKFLKEKDLEHQKAEKEKEAQKISKARTIAMCVDQFWTNVRTLVMFKEKTTIQIMNKHVLDQKLTSLVSETERYSEIVAKTITMNKSIAVPLASSNASKWKNSGLDTDGESIATPVPDESDDEFVLSNYSQSDYEDTIAEQEANELVETVDHDHEIQVLEEENKLSIEEIHKKYLRVYEVDEASPPETRITTRSRARAKNSQLNRKITRKTHQTSFDSDINESSTSEDESFEEESTNSDLASLLNSISSSDIEKQMSTEDETAKLSDLVESYKPTGNTLSSTMVVTKVPRLIRHQLREYQHIGLDWLVTMSDKKLNGILADEMGLGKTIQTIALLAFLAEERGNWGPHLIIVPTSVMLNWEMEFKKWCPGLKILTYYGSQKERKLKRTGWTKENAFHICITSYKLVIQDHQSFRRKRWKYLILDEAQNIKNFRSQRWQLLLEFHSQRRLLLTGTPLQNNLMELWSLLHFLMPNVFQSHMEFKDWFSNPMSQMVEGSQEYNEDIVRRLHKVLRPFILRRMKSEVEQQLPQKIEHVVICSLSKRQRYLYEEFMSRTDTKDILNQGRLLRVINVLMQLRKVCNHPDLFEPRPIVSPFQTEGVEYRVPPCVWNILGENQHLLPQDSLLFSITNAENMFDLDEAKRITELTAMFEFSPLTERYYIKCYYEKTSDEEPPAKRLKRRIQLDEVVPLPRYLLEAAAKYFSSFREHLIHPNASLRQPLGQSSNGSQQNILNNPTNYSSQSKSEELDKSPLQVNLSDLENSRLGTDGDVDSNGLDERKRKTPGTRFNLMTRLEIMGHSVADFELDYIQERKLRDRKVVVRRLNKVNCSRCHVNSFLGKQLIESCRVVDSLPSRRRIPQSTRSVYQRNFETNGYFRLGFGEIMKIIRIRQEQPSLFNQPYGLWSTTKCLRSLLMTPETRIKKLMGLLTRYVMYIPAVSAPSLECRVYGPLRASMYVKHVQQFESYRKVFTKPTEILHPVSSRMLTQFPDPRLLQYDCGKLQTLDILLRKLKAGAHRVLIFTQMAKVLDILESFLNYHGHTYLRLDGATKIDQRQLLMERFNADKKIFCFILSTRSGGIGVNLTGADTVIFYDSDWNPTMDAQAQDRCHRIGQTRDVHIYRLISEKTIEENILKKSNQKRLLGELAIEGGKFTTAYFKQNTIIDLFRINENNDAAERLSACNSDINTQRRVDNTASDPDNSDLLENKHDLRMIGHALAEAEDDADIRAAETVHNETAAEMEEFDENIYFSYPDEEGRCGLSKTEIEFEHIFEKMTDVERYALRLMETTLCDWSTEPIPSREKKSKYGAL